MLNSRRGSGHPCLVCCSRKKCRTPAPGQGCWTRILDPASRKGIHARLTPGLKSYMVVDCSLARKKKKKKPRDLRLKTVLQSNMKMVIAKEQAEESIFTSSADREN